MPRRGPLASPTAAAGRTGRDPPVMPVDGAAPPPTAVGALAPSWLPPVPRAPGAPGVPAVPAIDWFRPATEVGWNCARSYGLTGASALVAFTPPRAMLK